MQKPKALRSGDSVAIIAPASDVKREDLLAGAAEIQKLGFRPLFTESVFSQHYYFAGAHKDRAADLMKAFADREIAAILCARGGYGCHHLLPLLDFEVLRENPKIFMGYSDVTVLLQILEQQCDSVCFHGPMVAREFALGEPAYVRENLLSCLTQATSGLRIQGGSLETLRSGSCQGQLTGGCLSLLTATLGTPYEWQTKGRVLFLEDVNTKPYQVDRMLMHLKLAGKFEEVEGIAFGEMVHCVQSPDQGYRLQEVIFEVLQEYTFPILYGLRSGHTTTGSLTLPFGVQVRMDADAGYLQLEESAVVQV